jgi:ABC-type glycerol-3-phosphate transport system substrate-binding protein
VLTAIAAAVISVIFVIIGIFKLSFRADEAVQTIKIALPYCGNIENIETNYYKTWLEEQMKVSIEFVYIRENYTNEYLRLMFSSDNSDIDAVFFSYDSDYITSADLNEYGKQGCLLSIEEYASNESTNLFKLFSKTEELDLKKYMTCDDGHIYYMPCYENARQAKTAQVLWINTGWLKTLNLEIPETTEDFQSVLQAFKERDPNQNGIADEIPFISCETDTGLQGYHYLINAFIYDDPQNSYMYLENNTVKFAPIDNAWRNAAAYCNTLFEEGLLSDRSFSYSRNQFTQLINDKNNVVGAFTSSSIADVVNADLNRYIGVAPLTGPDGIQLAAVQTVLPTIGAVITSQCDNPQTVFDLLDLMLSEEASLIGKYGEQGVDWEFGQTGDISQYGEKAFIYLKNNIAGVLQNSNFSGYGPAAVPPIYLDGTTWNGIQTDRNYINVRTSMNYERFYPAERLNSVLTLDTQALITGEKISDYAQNMLVLFITGKLDIRDDKQWEEYLKHYDNLSLEAFLKEAEGALK